MGALKRILSFLDECRMSRSIHMILINHFGLSMDENKVCIKGTFKHLSSLLQKKSNCKIVL